MEERRPDGFRPDAGDGRGPNLLAHAGPGRRADRCGAPAALDRRRLHRTDHAVARSGAGRARPVCAAAHGDDGGSLVRQLRARTHRGGAAAAVRVRWRGPGGRLRTRDRRRDHPGADRDAGPAATRTRNDARVGPAGCGGHGAVVARGGDISPGARARGHLAGIARTGVQRRTHDRCRAGHRRRRDLRAFAPRGHAAICLVGGGGHRTRLRGRIVARPVGLACHAADLGAAAAARGSTVAVVPVARLAAGAVGAVAMARSPDAAAPVDPADRADQRPGREPGHGRLRPRATARPARRGRAGRVCAADPAPQHRFGGRLVLGVLLHPAGTRRVAHLHRDASRRAGQSGGQRGQARARLQTTVRVAGADHRDRGHRGVAVGGALAHSAPPGGDLAQPGAARWRRGAGMEPGHDLVAAAAQLRAQLPRARGAPARGTYRATCASPRRACRVH